MTKKEVIAYFHHRKVVCEDQLKNCPKNPIASKEKEIYDIAIEAMERQDKILQILDDCELEAWEVLEMIKEVVRI